MKNSMLLAACRRVAPILLLAVLGLYALPASAEARRGQLPNGLSYFIDPAKTSDGKISFLLVVRVGEYQVSPQDYQAAHVLEHIVIASDHVAAQKGDIRSRVAAFGGLWGSDGNAVTTPEVTRYFVKLPAGNPAALDAGLDILRDWVTPRSLSDEEIDRERKAVVEEARQGASEVSIARLEAQLRTWFPGNPLFDFRRDRIGEISAAPDAIRALHRIWYRPPEMALIVRGDVDPDRVAAEIAARFGSIPRGDPAPAPAAPAMLPLAGGHYIDLPSDGASESRLELSFKYRLSESDLEAGARDTAIGLIADRAAAPILAGLAERYDAPATGVAFASRLHAFAGTGILSLSAAMAPGKAREALAELLGVAAALRGEGLAEAEIEAARRELLQSLAAPEAEAAEQFERVFVSGRPAPSVAKVRAALGTVIAADVNRWLAERLDPLHRDVFLFYQRSRQPSVPDPAEFEVLARSAEERRAMKLARPEIREPVFIPFVPPAIAANPPVSETNGFMRWRLPRSGATLLYRRTPGAPMTLILSRPGGMARVPRARWGTAALIGPTVAGSGLAGLDGLELARLYAARGISMIPVIKDRREGIEARASTEHLPLLLDLVRAQLLHPLCRVQAFDAARRAEADREGGNGDGDPDAIAQGAFYEMRARALGSRFLPDRAAVQAATAEIICQDYLAMVGDASGMVIAAEGDLEPAELYRSIAATIDLPSPRAKRTAPVLASLPVTRAGRHMLRTGDGARANVVLMMQWLGKDERAGKLAAAILNERMGRRLRTVEKGTYVVSAGYVADAGDGVVRLYVNFDTGEGDVDRLIGAAKDEIEKLRADGGTADELQSARALVPLRSRLTPAQAAETWLARGTLTPAGEVSDAEVRAWIARHLDLARLHDFIRLPED